MVVEIKYNDRTDEYDIDSKGLGWTHTTAESREEAVRKGRRYLGPDEEIKIMGPRMNQFKTL